MIFFDNVGPNLVKEMNFPKMKTIILILHFTAAIQCSLVEFVRVMYNTWSESLKIKHPHY